MRERVLRSALLLAVLLTACQATRPLRPLPADDPRAAELLERWSRSVADRDAMRAVARLSVDAEGQGADGGALRVRSKQRIVLARPARLRVEVLGLLGTTEAVLAVGDEAYAWFESGSRYSEAGPVHDALLWNVVRLDLTPAEAVAVILGAPAVSGSLLNAWDLGEGVTRVALGPKGGVALRSLDLDGQARLRRFAVFASAAGSAWEARYDDYTPVGNAPVAKRVRIDTGSGTQALLTLVDVELNPALAPDIFRFEIPAGEGG